MTRKKKLIILAIVLVVCIAGYFAVSKLAGGSSSSDGEKIEISTVDSDKVEAIKWTYKKENIELKKNDDGDWYYTTNKAFPLDQETALQMLSDVSSISAIKKVADAPSELSKYGIDEPSVKIYVTVSGTTTEYDIGDYNEASGYYYMMYTGNDSLYYVDSTLYSDFSKGLLDIVKMDYLPTISTTDVSSMVLKNGDKSYSIEYYKDGNSNYYSSSYQYFMKDSAGKLTACDDDTVKALVSGFTDLKWNSCAAYNVNESELSKYGLDKPSAEFEINYKYTVSASEDETGDEESTVVNGNDTLLIGSACDDTKSSYYAMIKGSKIVCTVTSDTASIYMINSVEDLYSKNILSFSESDVKSMTVNYKGSDYTFNISDSTEKDDSGNESVVYNYKYNGKTVAMSDFVSGLTSLKAETVQSSAVKGYGDSMISVTLNYKSGSKVTVDVYKYDDDYCAVGRDGSVIFLVDENDCDDLADNFKTALKAATSEESSTAN